MEFKELVKKRRSCRSFKTSPISDQQIRSLLEAGCWAPSPLNLQPWEFIIIKDKEIKTRIRNMADKAIQNVIDAGGPSWVKRYDTSFLEKAPLLIAVLGDLSRAGLGKYFGQKYGAIQAASACIQNMMLAAEEMGFGTLWFTFFNPEDIRPILDIPPKLEIAGIIPLGIPDKEIKPPPRKDPKIYLNRYGVKDEES